jgi:MFS family permease
VRIDLRNPAPFGYGITITLGLIALVDRADSALVGGILPTLQSYFGFGDAWAGIVLSAPSIAALLLVVPAGRLADTRSRKTVLSVVIFVWGLLTFGAAGAPTFALFLLARILLGVATPLNIPASASIVGDLFRSEARTKAFAVLRVMEYLGFPLGVAVGGIVGGTLGWRYAFLIMGVPALVLSGYIAVKLREPRRGLADELTIEAERAGIPVAVVDPDESVGFGAIAEAGEPVNVAHVADEDLVKPGMWLRTKEVLAIRTLRWIIIGQALLFAGFAGLFSFAATFFYRVQNLPEGAAAGISGGIGLIGLLVGGAVASRIGDRHHGQRPGWRIFVAAVALCIASVSVLLFTLIPVLPIQILLYLLVNLANIIALANLGSAQADVIPARLRGTGFATAQFLVTVGSSFGALIVGGVSAYVISGRTDVTQNQVNDAKRAVKNAKDAGASQAVIDQLQHVYDKLDAVFGPAQAIGIRWGVGALFIVLIIGAVTIFRARATYDADAARVIAAVDVDAA